MIEAALAGLGTALFMILARSYRDLLHLVYDASTGLVASFFVVNLLFEPVEAGAPLDEYWIARVGLVVVLAIVTAGRISQDWPISGHLSVVLAIALVQLGNVRLPGLERLLYALSVPFVLVTRWRLLDQRVHTPTYAAIVLAVTCAAIVLGIARL